MATLHSSDLLRDFILDLVDLPVASLADKAYNLVRLFVGFVLDDPKRIRSYLDLVQDV